MPAPPASPAAPAEPAGPAVPAAIGSPVASPTRAGPGAPVGATGTDTPGSVTGAPAVLPPGPEQAWADAVLAAALVALNPVGLGGLWLRARHGPARQRWLAWLQQATAGDGPIGRLPVSIDDDRLLGGLDLTATLRSGRPVVQAGLLAQHDGRLLLAPMAERLPAATAARIAAVLDRQTVHLARDGFLLQQPARLGLVALDEGGEDDPPLPGALAERLALHLGLDDAGLTATLPPPPGLAARVREARARLPGVAHAEADIDALCRTAVALGVGSLRAPMFALQAARSAAAWQGHLQVDAEDLATAVRLVLAPRATRWPVQDAPPAEADSAAQPPDTPDAPPDDAPPPADTPPAPPPPAAETAEATESDAAQPPGTPPPPDPQDPALTAAELCEQLIGAALAALPAGLLTRLAAGAAAERAGRSAVPPPGGRSGPTVPSPGHGRWCGSRRAPWRAGARLDLVATLRAAAPHQAWRQKAALATATATAKTTATATAVPAAAAATATATAPATPGRLRVAPDDLHLQQRVRHRGSTAVFVVDASGSTAMHRLAEAKGAVELLLADCYVRRDQVALVVCRGTSATLLLPPTRSLVRAKRALAGQPGGGGTPLASALDLAGLVAGQVRRQGALPLLVLLTDGRANIARDGQPGRAQAQADTLASAARLLADRLPALVVDTAPAAADHRPAVALARALGATHLRLPVADAQQVADAVRGQLGR